MSKKTNQERPSSPLKATKMESLHHKIYKKAVQHYQTGNLPKTERLCRKILEVEENHLNAHNLLAAVCGQTGQLETAVTLLTRVIELNPGYIDAHNNLGITLFNLGRLNEAG